MELVDSQVHANQRGIEPSIAIVDAVGVDAAVIDIRPGGCCANCPRELPASNPFAEKAVARVPARFACITRFDPNDPEIDDLMAKVDRRADRLSSLPATRELSPAGLPVPARFGALVARASSPP